MKAPHKLSWNVKQLLNFSQNLASGFMPGAEAHDPTEQHDTWTSEKLINLSNNLSRGFMP